MPCRLMRKHNMHPSPWHSRLDYFNCPQELALQGILNSQLLNNFRNSYVTDEHANEDKHLHVPEVTLFWISHSVWYSRLVQWSSSIAHCPLWFVRSCTAEVTVSTHNKARTLQERMPSCCVSYHGAPEICCLSPDRGLKHGIYIQSVCMDWEQA